MNNSIPKKVGRFPAAPSSPVNLSGVAQRALKQARASTIGKDKAAQAWDGKMSHADKKIILLAAQLPESFAKKRVGKPHDYPTQTYLSSDLSVKPLGFCFGHCRRFSC